MNIHEIMESIRNDTVLESFFKADRHISTHSKILCSVSGGSDSDIMVDMLTRLDTDHKITYVFFDTGVEYQATKDHLDFLEEKYKIKIERERAVLPIPSCCKKYGQPFLSKYVSKMIEQLQRHDFKWEDEPFEDLLIKYPKCKSALKWWCSWYDVDLALNFPTQKGNSSKWSISRNKYLKEFMLENPPTFQISSKCCTYAKKKVSANVEKKINADLLTVGVRKAEGGVRAGAYKSCYGYDAHKGLDVFRPLFWYTQADKDYYCERFEVTHSRCYSDYGLKRTGCVGCPFNKKITEELSIIEENEPKLYKACTNMFAESYEYTRKYREFVKTKKLGK